MSARRPTHRWTLVYAVALVVAMFLGLVFGGDRPIGPARILEALGSDVPEEGDLRIDRVLLIENRIPRVILGALVGASLALAGALMQGLFRNPLASPGILGATAGGAFGAVLAVSLGLGGLTLVAQPLSAVAGTLFALTVVSMLATIRFRVSILHLLLCGIAVNTLFSAGTSLILTFSADRYWVSREIIHWLTGSLSNRGWSFMPVILPFFVVSLPLSLFLARPLNLLLMGEESAHSLGADTDSVRRWVLLLTALLTGGAVAVAGMIGFVGLVAPHIVRLIQGPDHRGLLVSAPLFGGAFLLACDVVAQNVIRPDEIQLGIITSLVGGPFFLYLIVRDRGRE